MSVLLDQLATAVVNYLDATAIRAQNTAALLDELAVLNRYPADAVPGERARVDQMQAELRDARRRLTHYTLGDDSAR